MEKEVVGKILDTVESIHTSGEERLEDRGGARGMNVSLNESDNAHWLSKIISPLLAIIVVLGAVISWILPFFGFQAPLGDGGAYMNSAVLAVLMFYFGDSIKQQTVSNRDQRSSRRHARRMARINKR